MNIVQIIARRIIKISFDMSVSLIEYFSEMENYHQQVANLRRFEKGSLGKEIANCLDHHNLTLVPRYESHDLKHVLLDYKMTAEDEIRMQAFMIGNGNYSIPSFTIFFFGAMLLPDLWSTFYKDFNKGRQTIPIASWTIEAYGAKQLNELRAEISQQYIKSKDILDMKRFTKFSAIAVVLAGVMGMLYCLPFLFSSNIADLVGAGFPFVGGTILVVGGLLVLSNLAKETQINHVSN